MYRIETTFRVLQHKYLVSGIHSFAWGKLAECMYSKTPSAWSIHVSLLDWIVIQSQIQYKVWYKCKWCLFQCKCTVEIAFAQSFHSLYFIKATGSIKLLSCFSVLRSAKSLNELWVRALICVDVWVRAFEGASFEKMRFMCFCLSAKPLSKLIKGRSCCWHCW